MELEHVADFGPEVAREPLEERPPRKLMVTQLEDHKAHAGEHAQGQVLCRGRAAAAPLGAQGLAKLTSELKGMARKAGRPASGASA